MLTETYQDSSNHFRVNYTYDQDGNVATETRYSDLAGSTEVGFTQLSDNGDEITSISEQNGSGTVLANYSYAYDNDGRLASKVQNSVSTSYGYNAAGELTLAGTQSYSYDEDGNSIGTGISIGPDNQLHSDGTWDYSYDAAGNEIGKTGISNGLTWSYGYDDANEMTSAVETNSGGTIVESATYVYNVLGNRIEEISVVSGTTTAQRYVYGNDGTLYADQNGSNTITTRYVADTPLGANHWQAAVNTSTGVNWLLSDYQGSVCDVVNNSGTILCATVYDAFGNITSQTNASNAGRLGFQGGQTDIVTGLELFDAREYNSATGRWNRLDPKGFAAGQSNLYEFVGNGPTDGTDPTGTTIVVPNTSDRQNVMDAIGDELRTYHTYATGEPGNPDLRFSRGWGGYFASYATMDNLSPDYFGPIGRYLARIAPLKSGSDDENMNRLLSQCTSDCIKLIVTLSGEGGSARLNLKSELNSSIYDIFLEKTQFFETIRSFGDKLPGLYDAVCAFANELGASSSKLISALRYHPIDVGSNLVAGIGDGFREYLGESPATFFHKVEVQFLKWLFSRSGGLEGVEPPQNTDLESLASFAYHVVRKTSHIDDLTPTFFKNVLQDVSGIDFDAMGKNITDIQNGDIGSVLLRQGPAFVKPLATGFTGNLSSMVMSKLVETATTKILKALPPGLGQIGTVLETLFNGVQFLSDDKNIKDIKDLLRSSSDYVKQIVNGVTDGAPGGLGLVSSATNKLLVGATPVALNFLATLLGAGKIPGEVGNALNKLDLRSYVYMAAYKIAEKVKKSFADLFSAANAAPLSGKVALSNKQKAWLIVGQNGKAEIVVGDPVTDPGTSDQEKEARKIGNLEAKADQELTAALAKATPNANSGKGVVQPQDDIIKADIAKIDELKLEAKAAVAAAANQIVQACPGNACFAAGTRLLTPEGSKRIEEFQVGDWLLSRSEGNVKGPLEPKQVLTTFQRTGIIMELEVAGQVIRTTGEHPFYVRGQGWVEAVHLAKGDLLSSHDGEWVAVEDIRDTEQWKTLYNLRVADYHTYFAGGEGCAVWAHNSECAYHVLVPGCTPSTYDLVIYQQVGWSSSQIADANAKVQAINAAPNKMVVHDPVRHGKEQKVFRTTNNLTGTTNDADHIIDLQLGGSDTQANLWKLDKSVNRSMGSSIRAAMDGLPDGTPIRNLIMRART